MWANVSKAGLFSALLVVCSLGIGLAACAAGDADFRLEAQPTVAVAEEVPSPVKEASLPPTFTPTPLPTATLVPTRAPTSTPGDSSALPSSPTPSATEAPADASPELTGAQSLLAFDTKRLLDFLNSDPSARYNLAGQIENWGIGPRQLQEVQGIEAVPVGPVEADLDGDGEREIIIVIWREGDWHLSQGMLLIIDRRDGVYQIVYQDPAQPSDLEQMFEPSLLRVADLSGDGAIEVLYLSKHCGAHTCFLNVHGVTWRGSAYAPLFDPPASMAYAVVSLEDTNGDGRIEVVLTGGMYGSVGAGLQRERSEVYGWNGDRYVLQRVVYEPSPYLYFKVIDANLMLVEGNYAAAIALYRQAVEDDSLLLFKPLLGDESLSEAELAKRERDGLRAFALFRLVVTHALAGDTVEAERALSELRQRYPDSQLAEAARLYWNEYPVTGSPAAACAPVVEHVAAHPEVLEQLNGFGYANEDFGPEDVCFIPAPDA